MKKTISDMKKKKSFKFNNGGRKVEIENNLFSIPKRLNSTPIEKKNCV